MEVTKAFIALILSRKFLSKIYKMGTIKYNEISLDNIKYNKPVKVETSYMCSMGYSDTQEPIYIQTPKLKCKIDFDNIGNLDVIIPNDFSRFLISLDENNIKNTFSNSKEWFNKELPYEAIDDMYQNTIKDTDIERNNLRVKIPIENDKILCSIYNQDKIYMNFDDLKKFKNDNLDMILILHLRGLKIYRTKFVLDVYVSQMKVCLNNYNYNINSNYLIIDEDEDENDKNTIFTEEIMNVRDKDENDKVDKDIKNEEDEDNKEKEKMINIQKIQEEIQRKQKELEKLLK